MDHPPRDVDLQKLGRYGALPPEKRRRGTRAARTFILVLLGGALVASPWLIFTRDSGLPGSGATPAPSPTASAPVFEPTDGPTETATAPPVVTYRVTSNVCLRVRLNPSQDAPELACVEPGGLVRSRGRSEEAEGRTWLFVHDPASQMNGWSAAEFLEPVEPE